MSESPCGVTLPDRFCKQILQSSTSSLMQRIRGVREGRKQATRRIRTHERDGARLTLRRGQMEQPIADARETHHVGGVETVRGPETLSLLLGSWTPRVVLS